MRHLVKNVTSPCDAQRTGFHFMFTENLLQRLYKVNCTCKSSTKTFVTSLLLNDTVSANSTEKNACYNTDLDSKARSDYLYPTSAAPHVIHQTMQFH